METFCEQLAINFTVLVEYHKVYGIKGLTQSSW